MVSKTVRKQYCAAMHTIVTRVVVSALSSEMLRANDVWRMRGLAARGVLEADLAQHDSYHQFDRTERPKANASIGAAKNYPFHFFNGT